MCQSTKPSKEFPCNRCGLCCQKVHLAAETRFLDRGDGVCRNYDQLGKVCSVYEQRPDICRVNLQFERTYAQQYSWEEFIEANLIVCELLQAQASQQES
ncbi:YkgJ family cysteine cluster protein [Halomonas sp. DP8Y7-1]|nr:YkgJ family cysteine cluster protein [Halomonas sp. DP8Y7-1]